MNFGIVTISNGRKTVLKLFLASITRLRTELDVFIPVVCVGDAEHKGLCDEYHVHHITQANHPASRKWNTGVEYLMGQGVQYITILGSDDIASTDLVKNLIKAMEQDIDLISVSTIYFYAGDGRFKGTLKKLVTKQLLGVCRTIHRRVIEKTGVLWTRDRSWGMDGDCYKNISPHVQTRAIVQGVVVDVKSCENLNKFSFWHGKIPDMCPVETFYNILSEEEKQILNEI